MKVKTEAVVRKIETELKQFYNDLKSECNTYGELREKIRIEVRQLTCEIPEIEIYIRTLMIRYFNEDVESLQIVCNGDDRTAS